MLPLYVAVEFVLMALSGMTLLASANGFRLAVSSNADGKTILVIMSILIGSIIVLGLISVVTLMNDPISRSWYVFAASGIMAIVFGGKCILDAKIPNSK